LAEKGELQGAGDRPVSAEQMELARLRAELARVKMERDILKKASLEFQVGRFDDVLAVARGQGRAKPGAANP
jgi:transposase-like protein